MSTKDNVFSERLLQLMQARRVNASDVSRYTGISEAALSRWKSGKQSPNMMALISLSDYFGVTIDYLVGHDEPTTHLQGENQKN